MEKHHENTSTPEGGLPIKNVLLVENNSFPISVHIDALLAKGYQVDAVKHCRAALTKLTSGRRYDIVLIDIDLPDLMMGEVVSFIQQEGNPVRTRIMALTTRGIGLPMIQACINSGIISVIPKPLSADYLCALLEEDEEAFGLESIFVEPV